MNSLKAHAKLNLFLEIIDKRADGYHHLQSQVVFLDLADEISVSPANEITITGANIEGNIVINTAKNISRKYNITQGAEFTLQKNIPIGGGLGGGSADAAAAIVLLNELWQLNIPEPEMYIIAQEIGADVPVCLYSILQNTNTAYMEGIGEKISISSFPNDKYFLLVNPNIELATEQVFKNTELPKPQTSNSANYPERQNHLQEAAIKLVPQIAEIIQTLSSLESCELARMSGSGTTCFAIFGNEQNAIEAEKHIKSTHPNWWVCNARLKSPA